MKAANKYSKGSKLEIFFRNHWPIVLVVIALALAIETIYIAAVAVNKHSLIYALDDPYIHMAMAKNFSQHGVWGITPYEFSSSSSSVLWTLLLSLVYFCFGVNEIAPFLLNLLFTCFLFITMYSFLRRARSFPLYNLCVLAVFTVCTPILAIIFMGQEHILQIWIDLLLVYFTGKVLARDENPSRAIHIRYLYLLCPLATMIRFEGILLVSIVCLLFLLRKEWKTGAILLFLSFLPIVSYGLVSWEHGWYFLPNSVLLKGVLPSSGSLLDYIRFTATSVQKGLHDLILLPYLYYLIAFGIILVVLSYLREHQFWNENIIWLLIFLVITFIHLSFTQSTYHFIQFGRNLAYIRALGLFAFAMALIELVNFIMQNISDSIKRITLSGIICLSVLVLGIYLADTSHLDFSKIPNATNNIYEQQYQMGLFLKEFYNGEAVALNDIGAVNFLADIHCIDIWGIGTLEVARSKLNKEYDRNVIDRITKSSDTKVAIVYDWWYKENGPAELTPGRPDGLPAQWVKAGEWRFQNQNIVVCGGSILSFYATDSSGEQRLIQNLQRFSQKVSPQVIQIGKYIDN